MEYFLRNKDTKAVITGGTQGLGLAVAKRLIKEGAKSLVISGRRKEVGEAACAELISLGADCHFVAADVSKVEDCFRLIETAIAKIGDVNALVNSSAITERGTLLNTTPEMWAIQMDTNVRGPFFLMQRVVAHWLDKKIPGTIVNVLSQSAYCGQSFLVPYSTSKGAFATLTKNVANTYMRNHIRCNGIMLGWMDTPGETAIQKKFHGASDDWLAKAEAERPLGQLAKPDQVASLMTYLLSPESGVMTGALVDYDQSVVGAQPE